MPPYNSYNLGLQYNMPKKPVMTTPITGNPYTDYILGLNIDKPELNLNMGLNYNGLNNPSLLNTNSKTTNPVGNSVVDDNVITDVAKTSESVLPILTAGITASDTLNSLVYNLEKPMSNDTIFDIAQRGTAEDRSVSNRLADLVFTGNGLWGESSEEREIKEGVKHARDIAYDLGNTFNSVNSVEGILNVDTNTKMPALLSDSGYGRSSVAAKEINPILQQGYKNFIMGRNNQLKNIAQRNQRQQLMNYFDNGGSLDELNGVTKFNVGGSHSENPYEGIQQGIASDGNPNLVEEGEIKYKDYIYSARLKPSKYLLKEFNLPDKYVGKTFAEVADILQKESEDRPNDPISKTTLDEWMSRLAGAQEEYKAKAEQRRLAKLVNNMSDEEKAAIMLNVLGNEQQGIDLGQPIYANGGGIHIKKENRGKFTASAKRAGMGVQEFARHVLANKDKYSSTQVKRANFARNAKKFKHEEGGYLFPKGGGLNPFDYATRRLTMPWERIDKLPSLYDQYEEQWINDAANELVNMQVEQPAPKEPLMSNEAALAGLDAAIESTPNSSSFTFNPEYLRHFPVLGAAEATMRSLQPKDFTVGNEYRQLSSQLRPIAAPHIGGYRRYNPYDVNLGDIENIALTANALAANRGQNRATQGTLNAAVINAAQKTAAARNLAAQQANEANRLATDQYNLGINQFNAQRDTQYDQLNQQILNSRLEMLAKAALADDASKEAWANMYNTTRENFFNQLGNVGRDEWNRKAALSWMAEHPELVNTDIYKLIAGKYGLV